MRLTRFEGDEFSDEVEVLWEIAARSPKRDPDTDLVESFTVGATPEGYEEVVPLEEPVETGVVLGVNDFSEPDSERGLIPFDRSELRRGRSPKRALCARMVA